MRRCQCVNTAGGHCSPGSAGLGTDHLGEPSLLGIEIGSGGAFMFSDRETARTLFVKVGWRKMGIISRSSKMPFGGQWFILARMTLGQWSINCK